MAFTGLIHYADSDANSDATGALKQWLHERAESIQSLTEVAGGCAASLNLFQLKGAPMLGGLLMDRDNSYWLGHVHPSDLDATHLGSATSDSISKLVPGASSSARVVAALPETDYSFAYFDKTSFDLIAWRSPMGARSFFYYHMPGVFFAFASLPEPLLALPGCKDGIDFRDLVTNLVHGLAGQQGDARRTHYSNLRRLEQGHGLIANSRGVSQHRFWSLPENAAPAGPPSEFPERFAEAMTRAVTQRLPGITEHGCHLSGGLDSSLTTALAHRELRCSGEGAAKAYIVHKYSELDELVDPHEAAEAQAFLAMYPDLPKFVLHKHKARKPYYLYDQNYLDRPLLDMVFKLGPEDAILRRAQADGMQSMITGQGGDHMATFRVRAIMVHHLLERNGRGMAADLAAWGGFSPKGLWNCIRHGLLPGVRRMLDFNRRPKQHPGRESIGELLLPGPLRDAFLSARPNTEVRSVRDRRRAMLMDSAFQDVMDLYDWLGQRYGVLFQHPMLDRQLLELCDSMPLEQITQGPQLRKAVFGLASGLLPQSAQERRKQRLAPRSAQKIEELPSWAGAHAESRAASFRTLAKSNNWLHEHVDFPKFSRLHSHQLGNPLASANKEKVAHQGAAQFVGGPLALAATLSVAARMAPEA